MISCLQREVACYIFQVKIILTSRKQIKTIAARSKLVVKRTLVLMSSKSLATLKALKEQSFQIMIHYFVLLRSITFCTYIFLLILLCSVIFLRTYFLKAHLLFPFVINYFFSTNLNYSACCHKLRTLSVPVLLLLFVKNNAPCSQKIVFN